MLLLERASRLIDVSQALRYLLTLRIRYLKDSSCRRLLRVYLPPTSFPISMMRPTGMGHGCLDGLESARPL
jgi:hypothetical protein